MDSMSSFFKFGGKEGNLWNQVIPLVGSAIVIWALYERFYPGAISRREYKSKVNVKVKKSCDKVVDSIDIEDIGNKAVFCRCWRSSKFPYCDGTHNKFNELSGDNVGPLIIKKRDN